MAQLKQLVTQYDSSSRKQFAAQYIETDVGITGTGDIDTGTENVTGTLGSETVGVGIVDTGTADVSGAIDLGQPAIIGTGDIDTGKEDVAGVVTMSPLPEITVSGAIDVGSADATGTATIDSLPSISGTGSVDTGAADMDGVIAADPLTPITATGAVDTKGADITGIVTMTPLPTLDGSGSVDVGDTGVSGVVDVQPIPPITGAGDIDTGVVDASGEISKGPIPPITGGGSVNIGKEGVDGVISFPLTDSSDYYSIDSDKRLLSNVDRDQQYFGTHGYSITLITDVDLTKMTQVRVVIARPPPLEAIKRDLPAAEWNTLVAGDKVAVNIEKDDIAAVGEYFIQLHARRVNGLVVEQAFASEPYRLDIQYNVAANVWN